MTASRLAITFGVFLFSASLVSALRVPVRHTCVKRPSPFSPLSTTGCSDSTCSQLGDVRDTIYTSSITVGGKEFTVSLDTSSSDLWVNASAQPIPGVSVMNDLVVSLVYGDSSNFTGPVAVAPVTFHSLNVSNQSFVYATQSQNDNFSELNITGLIGLGFDDNSRVFQAVKQRPQFPSEGLTFLSNLVASNVSFPKITSFLLNRALDSNKSMPNGIFTVGEIEQGFERVNDQPAVPLAPSNSSEWTIPMDDFLVNNQAQSIPRTVVSDSNATAALALLDTGSSSIFAPSNVVEAVYTPIQGAQTFEAADGAEIFILPCEVIPPQVAIVIGGQQIAIHPLDLNTIGGVYRTKQGTLITVCVGSMVASAPQAGRFNFLLGTPFLRNTYTVFNYGSSGNSTASTSRNGSAQAVSPSVKLLSITSVTEMNGDFKSTRQAQLTIAPAASADEIGDILNGSPDFTPVDPENPTSGPPQTSAAHRRTMNDFRQLISFMALLYLYIINV